MYDFANFVLLGAMLVAGLGVFLPLPFLWNSRRAALGVLVLLFVVGVPMADSLKSPAVAQKYEAARAANTTAKRDTYDDVYANPESYLAFDARPVKNCGGRCLDLSGSIQNTSSYAIKDAKIRCDVTGESGKRLDRKEETLSKVIKANSTVRFSDLSLGIIDQQAAGANCTITDADIAQGELPGRQ